MGTYVPINMMNAYMNMQDENYGDLEFASKNSYFGLSKCFSLAGQSYRIVSTTNRSAPLAVLHVFT